MLIELLQVAYEASDDGRSLVRSRPSNNVVVSGRYPYEITASISDIEGTLRRNAENAHVKFLHNSWPVSISVLETKHSDSSADFPVKVFPPLSFYFQLIGADELVDHD